MDEAWKKRILEAFSLNVDLHRQFMAGDLLPVITAAEAMITGLARGGKLLIFGNGGSAADAQHVAAELIGRFQVERRAIAAIALTTDTSVLTSLSNDYAYERVFARQIEAIGAVNDVGLAISTSGRSSNVLLGIVQAKKQGLRTIALTGRDGGDIGAAADIHINVPSPITARVQEVHRTVLHALCDLIETEIASAAPRT